MNRHVGRIGVLVGGAALASSLLAAGSSAGSTATGRTASEPFRGQTLTLAVGPITENASGYDRFYADLKSAFHKATGANLVLEYTETSGTAEDQIIETAAATHSGPDMMELGTTVVPAAYYSGAFRSLNKHYWTVLGGQSAFYPGSLGLGGPNTRDLVGVPSYNVPYAIAINTYLFHKAGITHAPTTWTQYVQDAQKINDPSAGIYGTTFDPADAFAPWKAIWWYVKELGGDYVSKNLKSAELDSSQVQQAMEFWFDWFQKWHIVPPNSLTWTQAQSDAAFASGKVGEALDQLSSNIPLYESGGIGNSFAFAPFPTIPYGMSHLPKGGIAPGTFVAGNDIVVAKYANFPLAIDFLKVLLSNNIQLLQYKLTGNMPVTESAGTIVEKSAPAVLKPLFKIMQTQVPTPFVSAFGTIETALASASQKISTQIATSGSASNAFIQSVLSGANSAVQPQL